MRSRPKVVKRIFARRMSQHNEWTQRLAVDWEHHKRYEALLALHRTQRIHLDNQSMKRHTPFSLVSQSRSAQVVTKTDASFSLWHFSGGSRNFCRSLSVSSPKSCFSPASLLPTSRPWLWSTATLRPYSFKISRANTSFCSSTHLTCKSSCVIELPCKIPSLGAWLQPEVTWSRPYLCIFIHDINKVWGLFLASLYRMINWSFILHSCRNTS